MMPSNFIFIQLYIVVLIMVTRVATTKVPQSIEETPGTYNDQRSPTPILTDHHHHQPIADSKQVSLNNKDSDGDDDLINSNSDEEYINDSHGHPHHQIMWPEIANKPYPKKIIRASGSTGNGGDGRLWAIPYRFGKRSAMPYRFGKRAAMHFRLGKKSASL